MSGKRAFLSSILFALTVTGAATLTGCGSSGTGSTPAAAHGATPTATVTPAQATATAPTTPGYSPNQPPPSPTLADSYVFIGSANAAYIDLKSGIAAVAGLQQAGGTPAHVCVVTYSEEDVTYVQSGVTLNVKAHYIAPTPFTINPDGSIQHEVPQPDGTVATQRYVPGNTDMYNAAVQRLTAQYGHC